uniref:ENOD40-like protein n=1 Tax=Hordeum vulgare TaxID=4513 RepID=Q8H6E6_HORVU|nr:ENOD40-like protein [Hordeum vulgare]
MEGAWLEHLHGS